LRIDVLEFTRWDAHEFPVTMRVIVTGEVVDERIFAARPATSRLARWTTRSSNSGSSQAQVTSVCVAHRRARDGVRRRTHH